MRRRLASLLLVGLASLGCNGPWFLLPGGELEGETKPAPSDWSFAGDYGTIQLETRLESDPRPGEPYSVNLAYTVLDRALYVNAGGTETQWAKNIAAQPLVRLRMDEALYELRAERVGDREEIARFAEAWKGQSYFRRDPLSYDEVWIFKLVAR